MKIDNAWYINSIPDIIVVEIEGVFYKTGLTFKKVSKEDLSEWTGVNPIKNKEYPMPGYVYPCYGFDKPDTESDYSVSTSEAAKITGLTDSGIRRMVERGKLPARKIGGRWALRPCDVKNIKVSPAGRPRENNH